jgi:hypothetical protein
MMVVCRHKNTGYLFLVKEKCTGVTLFEGINSFDWVLNS